MADGTSYPNHSPALFLVQISAAYGGADYGFVEVALSSDATEYGEKVASGRFGSAVNPGVALDGITFTAGDFALARSADVAGGTRWELLPLAPSASAGFGGSGGACPEYGAGLCGPDHCVDGWPKFKYVEDVDAFGGILYATVITEAILGRDGDGRAVVIRCQRATKVIGNVASPGALNSCCPGGSGGSGGTNLTAGDGIFGGPGDPDTPFGGPASQTGCCPDGYVPDVAAEVTGPFGAGCAVVSLLGTVSYDAIEGAWVGTLDAGDAVTNRVRVRCVNGVWSWALLVEGGDAKRGGLLLGGLAEGPGDTLTGTASVQGVPGCADATATITVAHPCSPGGSGGTSPGGDPSCVCCPTDTTDPAVFTYSATTLPGTYTTPLDVPYVAAVTAFQLTNTGGFTSVELRCVPGSPVRWVLDLATSATVGSAFLAQSGTTLSGTVVFGDGSTMDVSITLPATCYGAC